MGNAQGWGSVISVPNYKWMILGVAEGLICIEEIIIVIIF